MKVFVCESLVDRKDPDRVEKRERFTKSWQLVHATDKIEFVDGWGGDYSGCGIEPLCRALTAVEECDIIVFLTGWHKDRHCRRIEEIAALLHPKKCLYYDLEFNPRQSKDI